ncbi:MAG: AAA family ATPase [Succinatimonas sp.]|nr:AAA family ATPase [Succinatimonas sp.]
MIRTKNFYGNNCIYVDKTKLILNLVKQERVLISRPRRFGKSLTLDYRYTI